VIIVARFRPVGPEREKWIWWAYQAGFFLPPLLALKPYSFHGLSPKALVVSWLVYMSFGSFYVNDGNKTSWIVNRTCTYTGHLALKVQVSVGSIAVSTCIVFLAGSVIHCWRRNPFKQRTG
jgi:hypothetical protein